MEDKKKIKSVPMNVSIDLKEYLDEMKKDLEHYLWDSANLSYAELTKILVTKIKAKQIKI